MKITLLIALFTGVTTLLSAQFTIYRWGAEATSNGIAAGQFQNDFVETSGTTYSNTEWTTKTISDGNGTGAASHAFWKRTTTLYSEGVNSDMIPLNSPTAINGAAIFDSDFLDNNGIANNTGGGTSPANQRSELISPLVDLTGYTDSLLVLKMFLKYDAINFTEASLSFSSDDGVTWGIPVDIISNHPNAVEGFTSVQFPYSALHGVVNLMNCRFKITFEGAYNYIMLDDLTLYTGSSNFNNTNLWVSSFVTLSEHTCGSYTSPSGNYTWSSSGTYYDTIPNSFNRDSMMMIQLSAGSPNTGIDIQTACDSYLWIDGNTYMASNNTATHTIPNVSGCDSVITLNLTLNTSTSATQTETALDSYTWPVNNQTYTASGQYTAIISNAVGCDSIITLDLTMNFTGLDELQQLELIAYPNPAKEKITLTATSALKGDCFIMDINGRILVMLPMQGIKVTIPLSLLSAGTYFVHFSDYRNVLKLIKE